LTQIDNPKRKQTIIGLICIDLRRRTLGSGPACVYCLHDKPILILENGSRYDTAPISSSLERMLLTGRIQANFVKRFKMQIGMSGLGRTVATMVHRFVKVIHDGIDYCIMCAFAEGSNARQNIDAGKRK